MTLQRRITSVQYRNANPEDWETIAEIHTKSWQENYRGSFSDHYLDNLARNERKEFWQNRFSKPNPGLFTIVAEYRSAIFGFACTLGSYDPALGSLLDNLHVRSEARNLGIGKMLLLISAEWAFQHHPNSSLYLYVLQQNISAIRFYERLGARLNGPFLTENPDGTQSKAMRCTWENSNSLIY
jgi:ribosomal protein S18 acetylase RimI-like enzyme